ncbi:NADH-quinone oxidoreductase subunit D [Amycolatopsis rubida]|uniref:NADH-quinone oxidoreductase subunit D n=1 Tax=Amycolatopsis rubida TaxID=112413 RepID=A0ABX0BSY7_9PSEU|nr:MULTISPECIES: NADH-quinone oxidoreductase subunit C [Amycolatopsis]MYW93760.1 NADH-quinone oxidoreductase subunit D [Amycolatopsis rubida]NEC58747.1 NADH-quinone oxidoreductase subunit D [Amycolatopsis rubida]OAP22942.1 Formate hydrogenlyase subunit 5 precursor [Amycolatopsis sp. M39]
MTAEDILARIGDGARFAALAGDGDLTEGLTLHVLLARPGGVDVADLALPPGCDRYPALTPGIPAAFWYERKLHDLYGVLPLGHPRLDPLVLPHAEDNEPLPSPGAAFHPAHVEPDERALPSHVAGTGLFSFPHGPVRSGVFESVEYVVETPGEDIPHVNVRPHFKHRGLEVRFEGMSPEHAVLLAERVEGIASVAHALAFCHAVEELAGAQPPLAAQLVRVLHAELERIANHLDVAMKLADAAGLAVAVARFGWHKERVLRLVSALCGSRFGRGVAIPGGIRALPLLGRDALRSTADKLRRDVEADAAALMQTASFLDRLRGTGPLDEAFALEHGLLGPVGRASGTEDDARWQRPYDAYPKLTRRRAPEHRDGDVMARLRVRWDEVAESFDLLGQIADLLSDDDVLSVPVEPVAGQAVGWAEAPQGEVLYFLDVGAGGLVRRCAPRSASFHNLAVFSRAFRGDVLTDFPFIEASFGLSIAGVVM